MQKFPVKHKRCRQQPKSRCESCGFTAKAIPRKCPNCGSEDVRQYSDKFRFSKKKRKNSCKILKSKNCNKLINGQLTENDIKRDLFGLRKTDKYGLWINIKDDEK